MEAVPRLHMLWFALKASPEGTSFANLKKYIAECYQEDPESYSKEVFALETLRNTAMRPGKDVVGVQKITRYYCQLHSLQSRFPQISERSLFTFTWKDLYQNNITEVTDMRYEMAAVLFNIAASHTQIGASVTRGDVDGMKLACTHFQIAAWSFGELKDKYENLSGGADFMTTELLVFMQQVSFAQAQECILEKSLIDNRKPNIVAKVTAQIIVYYGAALAALLTGRDDGPIAQVIDKTIYKLWKKYVRFKISYLNCILFLYQGQQSEEQQKMGERVTLYQAAWDKLEEARKESKGLPDQKEITESLTFTADVVEAKRKNAKNENEFIYHEVAPELADITAVQGANLVNGISFSVTDPDVAGEDIFGRLVPMKAHEASSLYSEEKAKILRRIGTNIEEKDAELASFMSSLTLDNLNVNEEKANKIPQGIVDRCASLNANKSAIPDLISSMSQLAEICSEVEMNLKEISSILAEEDHKEKLFQKSSGVHRSNAHITELTREFQKYSEAHAKAGESNDTLRKAMELHVNNLKILSKPLQEIQQSVPKLSAELNTSELFKDVKLILNKVNEMKAQRAQFHADLRIAVNSDDITAKVIAHGSEQGLQVLFDKELAKHEKMTQLIEQNLTAQANILSALTECYAKAAPVLKTLSDVKNKKDNFFSSLAASFDVYEDLLAKCAKGLEFYKKLSGNVQKLLTRVRAAKDVQEEDRQQRMKVPAAHTMDAINNITPPSIISAAVPTTKGTPKLKDYLKGKSSVVAAAKDPPPPPSQYIPTIRPNPLGSENPTAAVCVSGTGNYYTNAAASTGLTPQQLQLQEQQAVGPNEPPPPYSATQQPQQQYFYDPSGFTNPIYHNTPAPPYSLEATPYPTEQQFYPQANYMPDQISLATSQFDNMSLQNQQLMGYAGGYGFPMQQLQPQSHTEYPAAYPAAQQHFMHNSTSQPAAYNSGATTASSAPSSQFYSQAYSQDTTATFQNINYAQSSSPYVQQGGVGAGAQFYQQQHKPIQQASLPSQPIPSGIPAQPTSTDFSQQSATVMQNSSLPYPPQQLAANSAQSESHIASSLQSPYVVNVGVSIPDQQFTQPSMQYSFSVSNSSSVPNTDQHSTNSSIATQTNHPGYSYNPQTGTYDYGSGYHQAIASNTSLYGQYTSLSQQKKEPTGYNSMTTDSGSAYAIVPASESDLPIVSHTKPANNPLVAAAAEQPQVDVTYYSLPYGYQSNGNAVGADAPAYEMQQPQLPPQSQLQQHSIYMQSGNTGSEATQTTKSVEYSQNRASPSPAAAATTTNHQPSIKKPIATPVKTVAPAAASTRKNSNIDLLTDIDFSGASAPILPAPVLKPEIASPAGSHVGVSTGLPALSTTAPTQPAAIVSGGSAAVPLQLASPVDSPVARKSSCDNISICSDLSSLDHYFDWDSVSMRSEKPSLASNVGFGGGSNQSPKLTADPFADDKTLKYFHKEVERFEKTIESLNIKMLNGSTPLMSKWKEVHDLLAKDNTKRTTAIAKLFPEKNRSIDCIPFDHARVVLETSTDDYINAALIKNLGPGCPNFIIAQTPQQNTTNDFWSMIWSQKARTVVCLHTPNEILDPFWPQELNTEMHFEDFSVKVVKLSNLSHCTELNLKLSMNGADAILDLSLIQIKAWTKSTPTQIVGIARNVLLAHQQRCLEFNSPSSPLIMNCLTGSERSELIAIAICAILATQTKRPLLINVVDVWYRICSQRQNALKDTQNFELSMQIVLSHAHDVLNKRGIMTSYQMKNAPTVASKEKEEIKDPLNELDPLWKLKQK